MTRTASKLIDQLDQSAEDLAAMVVVSPTTRKRDSRRASKRDSRDSDQSTGDSAGRSAPPSAPVTAPVPAPDRAVTVPVAEPVAEPVAGAELVALATSRSSVSPTHSSVPSTPAGSVPSTPLSFVHPGEASPFGTIHPVDGDEATHQQRIDELNARGTARQHI